MSVNNSKRWVLGLATVCMISGALSGCDPVPRRQLSAEEKAADMLWIYSQFGENYAPLALKQQLHGFDYLALKTKYVEAAKSTKDNDEFYSLMFQFVAEFKDAHTSAALTNSSLPNRAQVAFLGFNGIRTGNVLIVKSLLPTITKHSTFPIKVGEKITKINGKKLADVVRDEQLKYRNIGSTEGNLTFAMNRIFTRVSTANGLPVEKDAIVTVERDGKEVNLTLPWVLKDLAQFQEEQSKASSPKKAAVAAVPEHPENFLRVSDVANAGVLKFNFIGFDGRITTPWEMIQKVTAGIGNSLRKRFSDGFQFMDNIAEWSPIAEDQGAAPSKDSPLEELEKKRTVLADAVYLAGSDTYTAYVAPVDMLDKDGKKTGTKKLVGYIHVDTFSPSGNADTVIKEFKKTLETMQILGAKDLIIDTINNGGGSLVLGMKMAQALSGKKVDMPKMQFRISDTWLDEFETSSISGNSDAEKEYSRRMYVELVAQARAGKRLSDPYSAEILAPFDFTPEAEIQPMRTVLLINEMCASMCDIFAGILQDNQMATIMGAASMGAGGNVVNHQQAPNSHLEVRQTESLILRKDGTYIENAGVTPDIAVNVSDTADKKFSDVIKKAAEFLAKPVPVAETPVEIKPAEGKTGEKPGEVKPTEIKPAEKPVLNPAPIKTAEVNF